MLKGCFRYGIDMTNSIIILCYFILLIKNPYYLIDGVLSSTARTRAFNLNIFRKHLILNDLDYPLCETRVTYYNVAGAIIGLCKSILPVASLTNYELTLVCILNIIYLINLLYV
jgi:hypothetical protein